MELPDGRLPESFGQASFPEPAPFEIGSPAVPVTPPVMPPPPDAPPTASFPPTSPAGSLPPASPAKPAGADQSRKSPSDHGRKSPSDQSSKSPSDQSSKSPSDQSSKSPSGRSGRTPSGQDRKLSAEQIRKALDYQTRVSPSDQGSASPPSQSGRAQTGEPRTSAARSQQPSRPAKAPGGRPSAAKPPAAKPGTKPPATDSPARRSPAGRGPNVRGPVGAPRTKRRTELWVVVVATAVVLGFVWAQHLTGGRDTVTPPPATRATAAAEATEAVEVVPPGGCGPSIGFLGAAALGPDGVDALRAVRLAVRGYNASSATVCKVGLVEADAGHSDPGELSAAVDRFGPDVVGVVGPLRNADVALAAQALDQQGLPFITPSAGDPASAALGVESFHRLYPTDFDTVDAAALLLKNKLSTPRVLVVRHAGDWETRVADRLQRSADVTVVATVQLAAANADYTALAGKIRDTGAQAVYFTGGGGAAADLVRVLRSGGFGGPVVGGEPMVDDAYARRVGSAGANTFALCGCADPVDAVFTQAFQDAYKAAPGRHAVAAYDAAQLLLRAVADKARSRVDVQQALRRGPFVVSQGMARFTATGDLDRAYLQVSVYRPDFAAGSGATMLPAMVIRLT